MCRALKTFQWVFVPDISDQWFSNLVSLQIWAQFLMLFLGFLQKHCVYLTVGKHNPPLCPVGQGSFKMDCFNVEMCSMVRRVQIWHSCWKSRMPCPPAKEEGDLPSCYQCSVKTISISDDMGVHNCIRYGQLACFGGYYKCWNVSKVLEQHILPSRQRVFQQDNTKPHTAAITTAWLFSRRVWELNWLESFTYREHLAHHYMKNTSKMTTNSSAAGNLYQARMGPNSNTKTPET